MHVGGGTYRGECGSQMTTCRNQFFSSTLCILATRLSLSGSALNTFTNKASISLAANASIVSGLGLQVCANTYLIPTCLKMLKIEVYNFVVNEKKGY